MPIRGFILHPTYRIESGRPVVHLFGRLESGESFLVRDTRVVPYFFVRASDAGHTLLTRAARVIPTDLRTMRGEPVARVEVATPPDTPPLRDALLREGVAVFEADVRFAIRYLIDRGIRGALTIGPRDSESGGRPSRGPGRGPSQGSLVDRVFEDPHLSPDHRQPSTDVLRLLSLDIETDPRAERVLAVSLAGSGADEVLVALPRERVKSSLGSEKIPGWVIPCDDERGLLGNLFSRLRAIDFDVLTGWNVIDFDLSVLSAAARRHGVPFEVGRLPGQVRVIRDGSFWGRSRAEITGRLVLDGIELLRGAFVRLDDYRLDTAAKAILGHGKVALATESGTPSGRDRGRAIEKAFREDLPQFLNYARTDAHLVIDILREKKLIDLTVRRSLLTGMPPDRVSASIASFDSLYLGELRRRGHVAPIVGATGATGEPTSGGAVLEPQPGLYENVLVFDFRSLYPSLIRTFNIDPLGYVPGDPPEGSKDLIRAPNGACFRRTPGILPEMLAVLFPEREEAKRRGDAIGSHAIKILMNSCYGVLATPACRFYSGPVANAITRFGQWVLHWARDRIEGLGYRVLYGDTDSLFVLSGEGVTGARDRARGLGVDLRERINTELREQIRSTWDVESHLVLEFEMLFLKLFLPSVRHGKGGARKRYAGLVDRGGEGAGDEVIFVGMEVVRRDWTALSKMFQRGLFDRLFRGTSTEAAASYLRDFVTSLREGRHDGDLVYRKALRKGLSEYTATTPPHVKAARLLNSRVGDLIEYVMTTAGPEPAVSRRSPIDYEHYVDKQIRPIAEQVLEHLGVRFDEALGEATQGSLF